MDNLGAWGQLGLYASGTLALVAFAIKQILTTMTSAYGSIITAQGVHIVALETQNGGQQKEIDKLKDEHEKCEQENLNTRLELMELQKKVDAVTVKVDDVTVKVNGK